MFVRFVFIFCSYFREFHKFDKISECTCSMPGLFLLYLSIFITLSISYPNAHAVLETKAANIPCLAASKKPPSYQ